MYTSLKSRMFSISFSVVLFILVVLGAILYELHLNETNFLDMYTAQQQYFIKQLAGQLQDRYESGAEDAEIVSYLGSDVEASGSRFFALSKNDTMLFAKNDITTRCLGSLKDKDKFFDSLKDSEVKVQKETFTVDGATYTLYGITDTYSLLVDSGVIKHRYYILLAVSLVSFVMVALLLTLVGSWNRTQKQLEGTRKELDIRNEKMEIISRETGTLTSDKTDILSQGEEIGISQTADAEFYNVYTIRMLLRKSEDATLKPLQMFFLQVVMKDRYYTKKELFELMQVIQSKLTERDVMGEIRKGQFIILSYRMSEDRAKRREERLREWCDKLKREKGIEILYHYVKEDDRPAIVRFEEECERL